MKLMTKFNFINNGCEVTSFSAKKWISDIGRPLARIVSARSCHSAIMASLEGRVKFPFTSAVA